MLKLHTISIPNNKEDFDRKITSLKKHFYQELIRRRVYNDHIITYHSFDNPSLDLDKCFNKFMIGKRDCYNNVKYNLGRVKRIYWIHLILDYMIPNDFKDPSGMIITTTDSVNVAADSYNLYIVYEKYKYVLIINVKKTVYMVSTAYNCNDKQLDKFLKLRVLI